MAIDRTELKRRREALAAAGAEPIDWETIRDMVRAPAYFQRAAAASHTITAIDRGASLEERANKLATQKRATGRVVSVKVMTLVWEADLGTPARKLVALKLADCANDKGESIYPSVATIAAATGITTRGIKMILADFRRSGLLRVARKGGWRTGPTRYRMDLHKLHGVVKPVHQGSDVSHPIHQ